MGPGRRSHRSVPQPRRRNQFHPGWWQCVFFTAFPSSILLPQANNVYLPGWQSLNCYSLLRVGLADWLVSCINNRFANQFFLSRDGGQSWFLSTKVSTPVGGQTGRTTLSAQAWSSASNSPQLVYAVVAASNGGYHDIFTSMDGGVTWLPTGLQNSVCIAWIQSTNFCVLIYFLNFRAAHHRRNGVHDNLLRYQFWRQVLRHIWFWPELV